MQIFRLLCLMVVVAGALGSRRRLPPPPEPTADPYPEVVSVPCSSTRDFCGSNPVRTLPPQYRGNFEPGK